MHPKVAMTSPAPVNTATNGNKDSSGDLSTQPMLSRFMEYIDDANKTHACHLTPDDRINPFGWV